METAIATTDADGPGGSLAVPLGEWTTWAGIPAMVFSRTWSEAYKYSHGLGVWLSRHVRDFDLVHIHAVFSHAPLSAAAACRRAGVPYAVRPLGTIDPWSLRQKPLRKKALLALGARRLLVDAAAIHYTSAGEKALAEQALGLSRGVVIALGIDPNLLNQPRPSMEERARDPYVLVLSRLHPKKNLIPLIMAFARAVDAQRSAPPWRLAIAGSGEPEHVASLTAIVERENLHDRVSFTGWVSGDRKAALLRHASVFAMPSLQENFGVSLVEAMAAGVPALVSRHVNLAGAVETAEAGWVVDGDESSLVTGLTAAMSSVDERARRGALARDTARQFAWPTIAGQIEALYRRVCRAPLSPAHASRLPLAMPGKSRRS